MPEDGCLWPVCLCFYTALSVNGVGLLNYTNILTFLRLSTDFQPFSAKSANFSKNSELHIGSININVVIYFGYLFTMEFSAAAANNTKICKISELPESINKENVQ